MSEWTVQVDATTKEASLIAPNGKVLDTKIEADANLVKGEIEQRDRRITTLEAEKADAFLEERTKARLEAEADFSDFFKAREATTRDKRARQERIVT